ncbi:MAG: hypothetical protein ACKVRN_06145 [Pyrinomonadaceae bacterium]
MDERIYTERQTVFGVALGGLLGGAYFFWKSFNAVGKPKHARNVAIVMAALLVVTIGAMFVPFFDSVPDVIFWGLQIGLTYGIYRGQLSEEVETHIEAGKPVFGWRNTVAVSVLAAVLTFGPLVALIYTMPNLFVSMTAKQYGTFKDEVTYDARNISEAEIDKIANALTSVGFFDETAAKAVYADKSGQRYTIVIACTEEVRDNPEIIEAHRELRDLVQEYFPTNPIVIELAFDTSDNVFARLE